MASWQSCNIDHVGYPKHVREVGKFTLVVSFYDGAWTTICKGVIPFQILDAGNEQDAKREAEGILADILRDAWAGLVGY